MSSLVLRSLDPTRVRPLPPTLDARKIATLILDGRAEVEGKAGHVSGPSAYWEVVKADPGKDPRGPTAHLSLQALTFAQALDRRDATVLFRRLYGFNSLPASPRRIRRLASSPRLRQLLDPTRNANLGPVGWTEKKGGGGTRGWIYWERSSKDPRHAFRRPTFKLYVSPKPEKLTDSVATAFPVLADTEALAVKVAAAPANTLRPDKMVIYFSGWRDLEGAAKALLPALSGLPAQGVPFSAALDGDGLLSWGIDPPWTGPLRSTPGPVSSRGWITRHLGSAMAEAKKAPRGPEPKTFALARLALAGFDDESFTPPESWRASGLP